MYDSYRQQQRIVYSLQSLPYADEARHHIRLYPIIKT